ncbi:zf-HC2 domain-containing protein [Micromonospora sp. NPDC049004]|uniref:zf-HC2 domain-containing protein n=1 Tax=Micromonospora sp. NPDC049004 TaxID=3154348 RepID=UPI00340E0462
MSDEHVGDDLLGLHHLGELDPAQSDVIHRHLAACAECRARADGVVETLAALALLADVGGEAPVSADDRSTAHVVARPHPTGGDRSAVPPDTRPTGRSERPGSRPGRPRTAARRLRLIRASGLLVLVLVLAGLGLGAIVRGPETDDATTVATVAAKASDTRSGASASVFLTEDEDGVTVRATVSGLRSGTRYVLYAVTSDGDSQPVGRWAGTSPVHEVTGELDGVRLKELSFFTVSPEAGGVVVSVYLPGVAGAPVSGQPD